MKDKEFTKLTPEQLKMLSGNPKKNYPSGMVISFNPKSKVSWVREYFSHNTQPK